MYKNLHINHIHIYRDRERHICIFITYIRVYRYIYRVLHKTVLSRSGQQYIYICVVNTHTLIYIYIYVERYGYTYIYIYIYIDIYIHILDRTVPWRSGQQYIYICVVNTHTLYNM